MVVTDTLIVMVLSVIVSKVKEMSMTVVKVLDDSVVRISLESMTSEVQKVKVST